jgi:Tol biopolymer transport system component
MRRLLLFLATCLPLLAIAQGVTITSTEPLLADFGSAAYYPVLSADGQKLLFTGENQQGLNLYNFSDQKVTEITTAERAGFGAQFGKDGRIYYTTQKRVDGLCYRSAMSYDAVTKSTSTIVADQRMLQMPCMVNGGAVVKSTKGTITTSGVKDKGTYVYTEGSKVIVVKNGVEKSYSPVESYAGYLWASLSPDGQKVMFFAAGKGIVVMDLNGNVLAQLGKYEIPCWLGNNYIVAQNSKDDGYTYTSSQIVLMKADGSNFMALTAPESMTMQPTTDAAGDKIVYANAEGQLYLMKVNINE